MADRQGPHRHAATRSVIDDASDISQSLRELSESFRLHERELATRLGLKPQEYLAIAHILAGGGDVGPVELAARLGIAVGTTSELLDRLQKLGHVRRERDATDKRRVRLTTTDSATEAVVAAITPAVLETDRLSDDYTPAEREVIIRFLRQASATFRVQASGDESR